MAASRQALIDLLAQSDQSAPPNFPMGQEPLLDLSSEELPPISPDVPMHLAGDSTPPEKQTFGGALANAGISGFLGTGQTGLAALDITRKRNQAEGAKQIEQVFTANQLDDDQFNSLISGFHKVKGIGPTGKNLLIQFALKARTGDLTPEDVEGFKNRFKGNLAGDARKALRDLIQTFPVAKEHKGLATNLAGGAGSIVAFIGARVLTGPGGAALFASLLGGGEAGQRAEKVGASLELQAAAVKGGLPIGLTEMAPLEKLFKVFKAGRKGSKGFKQALLSWLKAGSSQAAIEGTQEGGAQLMQNALERINTTPDKKLWDDVAKDGMLGFILGGIFGVGAKAIGDGLGGAPDAATEPPAPPGAPGAQEVAPVAPDAAPVIEDTPETILDEPPPPPEPPPPAAPSPEPVLDEPPVEGDRAITPRGQEIRTRLEVVEGDELVTSQRSDDLSDDPRFPRELQNRQRTRQESTAQITRIATDLEPELLGPSIQASDGAPIVGPTDNIVEGGNARVLAIRQAQRQGLPGSQAYRAFVEKQGFDTTGMRNPVLVRRRLTQVNSRQDFVRDLNERTTAALSETEQGLTDASRITDNLIGDYQGGNLTGPANDRFIRRFRDEIVSPADQAAFSNAQGRISQAGVRRIENALFAKAYGDADLLATLREDQQNDIRGIGNALIDAAPLWARLRAESANGRLQNGLDITQNLLGALRMVREQRHGRVKMADLVAQEDMFSENANPTTLGLLRLMFTDGKFTRARSADKLARSLKYYATQAMKTISGPSLIPLPDIVPSELLAAAVNEGQGRLDSPLPPPMPEPGVGKIYTNVDRDVIRGVLVEAEAEILAALPKTHSSLPEMNSLDDVLDVMEQEQNRLNELGTTESIIDTPERRALQDKAFDTLVSQNGWALEETFHDEGFDFEVAHERRAHVIMGASATGKSRYLEQIQRDMRAAMADADEAKFLLLDPDRRGLDNNRVHEESTVVSNRLVEKFADDGANIVIPITGKSLGSANGIIEQLRNNDYIIDVTYVWLPLEKAAARNTVRWITSGKYVPLQYLLELVDHNPENTYESVKDRVDGFQKVSTDVERGAPAVVVEQSDPARFGQGSGRNGGPSDSQRVDQGRTQAEGHETTASERVAQPPPPIEPREPPGPPVQPPPFGDGSNGFLPPLHETRISNELNRRIMAAAIELLEAGGFIRDQNRQISDQMAELMMTDHIVPEDYNRILAENDLTNEQFVGMWNESLSQSARDLNKASQVAKFANRLALMDIRARQLAGEVLTKEEMDQLTKDSGLDAETRGRNWFRGMMDLWRGSLVVQFSTAIRNFNTQVANLGISGLVNALDNAIVRTFSLGKRSAHPVRNFELIYKAFSPINGTVVRPIKGKDRIENILGRFPKQYDRMFMRFHSDISTKIGKGVFRKAQTIVNAMNVFNRFQEFAIRGAVFEGTLRELIAKEGGSLDEMVARDEIGKIPEATIKAAVDKSLRLTWGRDFDSSTIPGKVLATLNAIPALYLVFPFPRFFFNSTIWLYEYSPFGALSLLTAEERAKVANGDPSSISKAIIGTGMFLTAYALREAYSDDSDRWYELRIGDHLYDMRPYAPFAAYLFAAEFVRWTRDSVDGGNKIPRKRDAKDMAMGLFSTQIRAGTGLAILDGFLAEVTGAGSAEKAANKVNQITGEFLGGYTTFFRQFRDLASHFDERERVVKDKSVNPIWGPTWDNFPGGSSDLPEVQRSTRSGPYVRFAPVMKQLTGIRRIQPKNVLEEELDRFNFKRREFAPSSGNQELDRVINHYRGELNERITVPFLRGDKYARMTPREKQFVLSKMLNGTSRAARQMAARDRPLLFQEVLQSSKGFRQQMFLEEKLGQKPADIFRELRQ